MFSIITNYKKMFFSFIKNEFAGGETPGGGEVEPLNNKPLDNNSFDGDAVSDSKIFAKMLEDGKTSTEEMNIIRASINNIHKDAQAELKKLVAELSPEKKVEGEILLGLVESLEERKTLMFKDAENFYNKVGATKNDIMHIQLLSGVENIDGEFGIDTFVAVKEFQSKNELFEDGKVGENTLKEMVIDYDGDFYGK